MGLGRGGNGSMRGQKVKQEIFKKIQEIFPNSFMDNKDLRINMMEDGELVQIKLTLTASKTIVQNDGSAAVATPAAKEVNISLTAPTDAEKADIEAMIRALGARIE